MFWKKKKKPTMTAEEIRQRTNLRAKALSRKETAHGINFTLKAIDVGVMRGEYRILFNTRLMFGEHFDRKLYMAYFDKLGYDVSYDVDEPEWVRISWEEKEDDE